MKFLLFAFLNLSFCAFAQEYPNLLSPNKVTTIGYWNNHASVKYEVKGSSSSFKGKSKKPRKSETVGYSFDLKVTDSTAESYTFELKYSNFDFGKDSDPMTQDISELRNGMKILYRTNELGQFDTILNLPELREKLISRLTEAKKRNVEKIKNPEDKKLYEEVVDMMISNFNDIDNIEAVFLTDIIHLHGYYGIEMQLSKTLDIELDYPCIGDFVLTGTGTLTLNSILKGADECNFICNEKPDTEELKRYIKMIAQVFFMEEKRKPVQSHLTVSMNTKNKMKMELSSGWMKKITTTSTVSFKDHKDSWKQTSVVEYIMK